MQAFVCLAFVMRIILKGVHVSHGVMLNEGVHTPSQDHWSSELTKRLESHSCRPGSLHKDTTLLHGLQAGTFKELGRVKDVEVCVLQCCETRRCELALFMNNYCYGITCYSQQHCKTAPAFGNNQEKIVTVFLYKTKRTNMTRHSDQETSQPSPESESKKNSPKFVFYPVNSDDSKELAFSVNLRNIAKHYTDNEQIKKVLREKANEHLAGNVEKDGNLTKRNSTLLKFLLHNEASSALRRHAVIPGAKEKTKPHPKENNVNDIEWNPNLLKAAISSSSVAILMVVLVLLAMSRKKMKATEQ